MGIVLKVPRQTVISSTKVTLEFQSRSYHEGGICDKMDRFKPHNCGEPVGRNLAADSKELSGTILVGTLPNPEKGM